MSAITELSLFKQCVESPIVSPISELNLEHITAPQDKGLSDSLLTQRKSLKLYHMAWSGFTKFIRQVCFVQNRPV